MAENETNEYWLDSDLQPSVMASLIRKYTRYRVVDSHQIDHEIMSFQDFHNQITVRGMIAYEPMLAELELEIISG